jgi:hypothetical protein
MADIKKKKKFPVVLVSILGIILISGIFITIRINNYMKGKRNARVENAIQEPEIDAQERKRGYGAGKGDLIGLFSPDTLKSDTLAMDSISSDSLLVEEPTPEPKKKVVPKAEKKPENALSATIEDETKKSKTPVRRKKVVQKKPENTNYRDVKFNFVIVKDDEPQVSQTSSEENEKSSAEDLTLYQAKIYGEHILKHMEPVTLRSIEDIKISSREYIPQGALLYGLCKITSSRMEIVVTRALTPKGNFPVQMNVFDNDFQEGIFIRGHDIDVQPEDNIDETVEVVGGSLPNQLLGTVINSTTKNVQKDLRKMKKANITVPDGYVVYVNPEPSNRKRR